MLAKCNGRTEEETKNAPRMGSYGRFRKGFAKGETYLSSSLGDGRCLVGGKGRRVGSPDRGKRTREGGGTEERGESQKPKDFRGVGLWCRQRLGGEAGKAGRAA